MKVDGGFEEQECKIVVAQSLVVSWVDSKVSDGQVLQAGLGLLNTTGRIQVANVN